MNPINDGGPAFPQCEWSSPEVRGQMKGMSLRDWFAGQALMGEMASQSPDVGEWKNDTGTDHLLKRATFLYRFADAMIAARNGGAA